MHDADDPRPNSPEDVGGADGYRRGAQGELIPRPVRIFEGGRVPDDVDAIDRVGARCKGRNCRAAIRWALVKGDDDRRVPLELIEGKDGEWVWAKHGPRCPDRAALSGRSLR